MVDLTLLSHRGAGMSEATSDVDRIIASASRILRAHAAPAAAEMLNE